MNRITEREALEATIREDIEEGGDAGSIASAVAEYFIPDHDKRVRAEQREQIITMVDASPAVTWTGRGGVRERIAAIREASDD